MVYTYTNSGTLTARIPRPAPANSFLFLLHHVTKSAGNSRFKLWITPSIERPRFISWLAHGLSRQRCFLVLLNHSRHVTPHTKSRLFNSSFTNRLIIPDYVIPATDSITMPKQNSPAQGFVLNFNSETCFLDPTYILWRIQFVTPNFQKPFTSDLTLFSSSHNRPPFTITLFPNLPHLSSCVQEVDLREL